MLPARYDDDDDDDDEIYIKALFLFVFLRGTLVWGVIIICFFIALLNLIHGD